MSQNLWNSIKRAPTTACVFYMQGTCTRGSKCQFYHPSNMSIQQTSEDDEHKSRHSRETEWESDGKSPSTRTHMAVKSEDASEEDNVNQFLTSIKQQAQR